MGTWNLRYWGMVFYRWSWPGVLIAAVVVFLRERPQRFVTFPDGIALDWFYTAGPWIPLVILALGAVVSLYFHSRRLLLLMFFLALVYLYLLGPDLHPWFNWESYLGVKPYRNSFLFLPLVIPAGYVFLHLNPDQGIFNLGSFISFALIFLLVFSLPGFYVFLGELYMDLLIFLGTFPLVVPPGLIVVFFFTAVALGILVGYRHGDFYDHSVRFTVWSLVALQLGVPLELYRDFSWFAGDLPLHHVLLQGTAGFLAGLGVLKFSWTKAYYDQLTQIPGRLALDEHLARLGGLYTLVMIDIDHFKDFNDTYGHEDGDGVLRQVAGILYRETTGRVYRFGGEEFTLVFPGCDVEQVEDELEHLRRSVEKNKVEVTRKSKRATKVLERKVTISLGAASSREGGDAEYVLQEADRRLYGAKEEGRNCVVTG